MDDARIKELTEEVLAALYRPGAGSVPAAAGASARSLEERVAALEARLRSQGAGTSITAVTLAAPHASATTIVNAPAAHPAARLLGPSGGGEGHCVLEPDKPCVGSGACRTFGH